MDKAYGECAAKFRDAVLDQFPLILSLDVAACKKDLRGLGTMKKVEWCLRSRAPLRLCVGLLAQPDLIQDAFAPDQNNHTVLCLVADLLQRLPSALRRCPLPDAPGSAGIMTGNPVLRMRVLHMALYAAELEQDYELGLALPPS